MTTDKFNYKGEEKKTIMAEKKFPYTKVLVFLTLINAMALIALTIIVGIGLLTAKYEVNPLLYKMYDTTESIKLQSVSMEDTVERTLSSQDSKSMISDIKSILKSISDIQETYPGLNQTITKISAAFGENGSFDDSSDALIRFKNIILSSETIFHSISQKIDAGILDDIMQLINLFNDFGTTGLDIENKLLKNDGFTIKL